MRLLNRAQAAERLGLAPRSLYALTRAGKLPAVKLGRVYRYDPDALDEWLRGQLATHEREPDALAAPPVNVADLDERAIEQRLLGALLAEQREVRRLLVRIGNRLAGGSR